MAILGAVLLLVLGAWWLGTRAHHDDLAHESEATSSPATSMTTTATTITTKHSVAWSFTDAGEDSLGNPRTKVTVTLDGKAMDAGTFTGSCSEIGADGFMGFDGKGLMQGEVSGAQCWFAGAGDEIGVFEEGGRLVVKVGEIGEAEEGASFRGNFRVL